MEFQLTEEQLAVQEAAREFAQKECLPGVIDRDRDMVFAKDQIMGTRNLRKRRTETEIPYQIGDR